MSSIVGITVLSQVIFGGIAYWIILHDNEDCHTGHLQQMTKTIQKNFLASELKINAQAYLEKLHRNFATNKSILLLNTNNTLTIAGIASSYASNLYRRITLAQQNQVIAPHGGIIFIDNIRFHWHSLQLDNENQLVFFDSCDKYKSGAVLGVRLLTTSIIITWVGIWVGLILSHIISRSLKAKNKELEYQAFHDKLTGLPNRQLLLDRLEQTLLISDKHNKSFALLIMDLDNFKDLNDTLGHHYGDELLQRVGEKTKQYFRKRDTFARVGGDEFAAILHDTDLEGALICIRKLLINMAPPHSIKGTMIESKASIGVALYPLHGDDSETLMQHADVAMYHAKKTLRGYAIYDSSFDIHSLRRLQLMNELRYSIENGHITVFYQPMISQRENCVVTIEALARWHHPELGFVAPDEFIPVAEQTGIIRQLTLSVLNTALRDCKKLRDKGHDICISINISPHCLQDISFPENLQSIVDNFGMESKNVELEITETAFMQDPTSAKKVLQNFHTAGFRLSIDDFGTGFSSLEYLKELPIDILKIDKTFVMDMIENKRDSAIVRSVAELGHNLNCKVVAEGVENEKILQKLIEFDIDILQGYLFSKAIPCVELENWLSDSKWLKNISASTF
ncbi:MAG: EAL domain-containing protein [Endozoicomonadaceae bacterium]|nr:EAL domain-containing protein [Endozoicomonadaceae bacterium]